MACLRDLECDTVWRGVELQSQKLRSICVMALMKGYPFTVTRLLDGDGIPGGLEAIAIAEHSAVWVALGGGEDLQCFHLPGHLHPSFEWNYFGFNALLERNATKH